MPKIATMDAEERRRKQILLMKIKAERGMREYTEEEMGQRLFGIGRTAYRRRMRHPGAFTLDELYRFAEVLKVPLPVLLGYKLDELEKVLI